VVYCDVRHMMSVSIDCAEFVTFNWGHSGMYGKKRKNEITIGIAEFEIKSGKIPPNSEWLARMTCVMCTVYWLCLHQRETK